MRSPPDPKDPAEDPVRTSVGRKLRQNRKRKGISQAELARQIGISPTYLNLLEHGKRSMQLPILYAAAKALDSDLSQYIEVDNTSSTSVLAELLSDPIASSLSLSEKDLHNLNTQPRIATTITALFQLYKNARAELDATIARIPQTKTVSLGYAPGDEVSDFLQSHNNYFAPLEKSATQTRKAMNLPLRIYSNQLATAIREHFGIDCLFVAPDTTSSVVREYDPRKERLVLSQDLPENTKKFQLCHVIGLQIVEKSSFAKKIFSNTKFLHEETPKLLKIHLANYFAGALLLPYAEFYRSVTTHRYDVEMVAKEFESTYETVAHRMCNLADPNMFGVPLHFLRVDVAGNISKRYTASGFRFPRDMGSCPKWAVHSAFLNPANITTQMSVMPDGSTFFCFAKVVVEPKNGSTVRGTAYSIGLGASTKYIDQFVYGDDFPRSQITQRAIPIGISCRFCERADCNQRAAPSYKLAFSVNEYTKKDNFFSPLTKLDKKKG